MMHYLNYIYTVPKTATKQGKIKSLMITEILRAKKKKKKRLLLNVAQDICLSMTVNLKRIFNL